MTQQCPPQLVMGARIAIVGDTPGPRELATGKPMAGLSALVLNKVFDGTGIQLDKCSLMHADDVDLVTHLTRVGLRPNVVVPIGEAALVKLCDVHRLTKYRGSVLPSTLVPGLKVVPTFAPEYIMRGNFGDLFIAQHDAKRILSESAFPDIRREVWTPITKPSFEIAVGCLNAIRSDELWSLDIETRADSLTCVGVGFGSTALCIPLQTTVGPYFTPAQELAVWQALGRLMRRNPNLVGQNLTFDLEWLLDYGILPTAVRLDTMLGFALLYPEFSKGLDMIVSLYTDAPYYKDDGKTWGWKQPDERLWYYNAQDCFYTLRAAIGIEKELFLQGRLGFVHDYINKEIFAALEMQRTRLKRNEVNHELLRDIARREAEATRAFRELASGIIVNINSPKQVKDFLYGHKKLTPIIVDHKQSVDENALKTLRTKYPDCQELELIIKERHLRKKLSSYLDTTIDPDGYLGCAWNIAGTETGRWSSGKSAHRRGLNLQTVPKLLRYSYEAPPGRVFIQPDLSQAEARVSAYLARCPDLIALFADPKRSVHMENALAIFGHEVVKDSKNYVIAKQCLHAANYKMGPDRFAIEAGISKARAQEILGTYYARYPELQAWHARTREAILQVGKLITPLGRERIFYHARAEVLLTGSLSGESWRNAIAYIPQATVPDVLNQGMLRTWAELDYLWLHHQGHDSCLVSVPYDRLGECCERLVANLAIPIPMGFSTLVIPTEIAWGRYWHPMVKWQGERDATPLLAGYETHVAEEMTYEHVAAEMA